MPERTAEDRLREEYFDLLDDLRRVADELEAEIRFLLLPIIRTLDRYEQIVVESRIKACDSAVDALRRRQEGSIFYLEREHPYSQEKLYSLLELPDLVGVRILAFPRRRLPEIDRILRNRFPGWSLNPIPGRLQNLVDFKYYGKGLQAHEHIPCEYQVVSMLTGLFWEVEHAAIYKPTPRLKGISRSLAMQDRLQSVYEALRAFEEEFELELSGNPS